MIQQSPDWLPRDPILVIGDACRDVFVRVAADRLSRETPLPVFLRGAQSDSAGGAVNVGRQIERLGVLAEARYVAECRKERYIGETAGRAQEVFRLDDRWPPRDYRDIIQSYGALSAVVLVDYQGQPWPADFIRWAHGLGAPLIGDARDVAGGWEGFDVLKASIQDVPGVAFDSPTDHLLDYRAHLRVGALILTCGSRGHIVVHNGGVERAAATVDRTPVANVSGAGDVFTGTLAVAVAGGRDIVQAANIAGVAAGLRVRKQEYNEAVAWDEIYRWSEQRQTSLVDARS
jgi:bifunctional ADP-heptose synthase (sugar kinase/adenylyltransferase)